MYVLVDVSVVKYTYGKTVCIIYVNIESLNFNMGVDVCQIFYHLNDLLSKHAVMCRLLNVYWWMYTRALIFTNKLSLHTSIVGTHDWLHFVPLSITHGGSCKHQLGRIIIIQDDLIGNSWGSMSIFVQSERSFQRTFVSLFKMATMNDNSVARL